MSVNLSRRDAIKGAMAVSAAFAATPYLGNLVGGVQASSILTAPAQAAQAQASLSGSSSLSTSLSGTATDNEALVLVVKNGVVQSYKGHQSMTVQDPGLAQKLRSAFIARVE